MSAINLYVWALPADYGEGMAVAVATSAKSAKEKLLASCSGEQRAELARHLTVEPTKVLPFRQAAAYCFGGGDACKPAAA